MEAEQEALPPIGRARRMVHGTATYAATSILQRSISFLLLPVYTRVLTPDEYGQIGIIATIAAAVGTVLALGLETAIFRTWVQLRGQPAAQARFFNAVGVFGLAVPVAAGLALAFPLGLLGDAAFRTPVAALALGVIAAGLNSALAVTPFALLRADERLNDYLRLSGLQAILGTGVTLLFVIAFDWGVTGWMLGTAVASIVVLLSGIRLLRREWSPTFDWALLRRALAFGIPMVPHAASHWGLALSDRVVLGSLLPTSEVGVYHIAYQVCLPITVIAVALAQSAQPVFAEAATNPDRRRDVERITTHQVLTVAMLASAVALLGPPAIEAVLPSGYAAAAYLIPWIAIGTGLFGVYLIPMNSITVLAGRSGWVWLVTAAAAVVNVSLNLVLVPRIGSLGAAIDTVIGYAVLLVGVTLFMSRVVHPPLQFEVRRTLTGITLIVAVAAIAFVGSATLEWPVQMSLRLVGLLAVAGLLMFMKVWLVVPKLGRRPFRRR